MRQYSEKEDSVRLNYLFQTFNKNSIQLSLHLQVTLNLICASQNLICISLFCVLKFSMVLADATFIFQALNVHCLLSMYIVLWMNDRHCSPFEAANMPRRNYTHEVLAECEQVHA